MENCDLKANFEILKEHYLDQGIQLIGVNSEGKYVRIPYLSEGKMKVDFVYGDDIFKTFTKEAGAIKSYIENGISQFRFKLEGMLIVDIDMKNDKDGLLELKYLINKKGYLIPKDIVNVEKFPRYDVTPNGGYHLYFKLDNMLDDYKFLQKFVCSGVELFYDEKFYKDYDPDSPRKIFMTSAGSVKDSKLYESHGKPSDIPSLSSYPVLMKIFEQSNEPNEAENYARDRGSKKKTLAEIIKKSKEKYGGIGRNETFFNFANVAFYNGYSEGEILQFAENDQYVGDLEKHRKESALKSAKERHYRKTKQEG